MRQSSAREAWPHYVAVRATCVRGPPDHAWRSVALLMRRGVGDRATEWRTDPCVGFCSFCSITLTSVPMYFMQRSAVSLSSLSLDLHLFVSFTVSLGMPFSWRIPHMASLNRRAFGWRGAGVETSDHRGTDLIVCWKSRATSSAESRISLESRRVTAVQGP